MDEPREGSQRTGKHMSDDGIFTAWPVDEGRKRDLYFYEKATEAFFPNHYVQVAGHGRMLMLGSYSYLGLNGDARINRAAQEAIERYGTGTMGVRLLAGTLDIHKRLEKRIAEFKESQGAVTFSSGFLANISVIASTLGRHDVVICDKLDHASLVDGCHVSQADVVRFRHNDMAHLEQCLRSHQHRRNKLVVVDAVFSMDGDIIELPEVSGLCRKYGALLMVDEAHSIGVLGKTGHGIEEHFGMPTGSVDIKMGTFSKAIPSCGGYIATSHRLAEAIRHKARGFIYSASVPASAAAASVAALDIIENEPERVRKLHENTAHFRARLAAAGLNFRGSSTPIFPIMCGDDWLAWELARYCQLRGVYVQAIPQPVVPKGSARLRACVTAEHTTADLDFAAAVVCECAAHLGLLNAPLENAKDVPSAHRIGAPEGAETRAGLHR
jgi:glycine C-acetyltransferase